MWLVGAAHWCLAVDFTSLFFHLAMWVAIPELRGRPYACVRIFMDYALNRVPFEQQYF